MNNIILTLTWLQNVANNNQNNQNSRNIDPRIDPTKLSVFVCKEPLNVFGFFDESDVVMSLPLDCRKTTSLELSLDQLLSPSLLLLTESHPPTTHSLTHTYTHLILPNHIQYYFIISILTIIVGSSVSCFLVLTRGDFTSSKFSSSSCNHGISALVSS